MSSGPTRGRRAEHVLRVASARRRIGVEILQDIQARRPRQIADALLPLYGVNEHFVRVVLTYPGDDEFVVADEPVREFIGRALGRRSVSTSHAISLVRRAACARALSPRYPEHQIRRHAATSRAP